MTDLLKQHNLKHTPVRDAVLRLFTRAQKPMDVQHILSYVQQEGVSTDRATVFRTVNTFTECGIARKVELGDGRSRYELASLPHHHHAVCVKCSTIIDIPQCSISPVERKIADQMQFTVITHTIEFYGTCASCS